MTLLEMTLPVPYAECKHLAIVYSYEIALIWYSLQQQHGDPRHVAEARLLTDGRWMLGGDLLSELYPGGIVGWACERLTPEVMSHIEVVPMSEVSGLLASPTLQ